MDRHELLRWGIAAGIALATWLVGAAIRPLILGALHRITRRTPTDLDESLVAAAKPQLPWWFLLLGVVLGMRYADPGAVAVARVDRVATAAFLLSLTWVAATFAVRIVEAQSRRWPGSVPATTLTQNAIRIVILSIGLLVVLGQLGLQIAPLLTALGVGSLAVALALQPTLANLFAGFHVSLAGRIKVGDYVELETGQQGYVEDIGWRSTSIRELPNNMYLVPNAKLAEMIVRNYSLPAKEQSVLVQVGVSYGSDLAHVERVTVEVAREALQSVTGAVAAFDPFIRYHTFRDSSINFSVILRVQEFTDRYLLTHDFIKRLHVRYAESGIEIPFPQRVLHVPGGLGEMTGRPGG